MKASRKNKKLLVLALIIAAVSALLYTALREKGRPNRHLLESIAISLCSGQRSYHFEHKEYAKSAQELGKYFPSASLLTNRYGTAEIYFNNHDFNRKYPNLLQCTEIGVSKDEYTILVVENLDKDDLPHITGVRNGCSIDTLVSDEYNSVLEKCEIYEK